MAGPNPRTTEMACGQRRLSHPHRQNPSSSLAKRQASAYSAVSRAISRSLSGRVGTTSQTTCSTLFESHYSVDLSALKPNPESLSSRPELQPVLLSSGAAAEPLGGLRAQRGGRGSRAATGAGAAGAAAREPELPKLERSDGAGAAGAAATGAGAAGAATGGAETQGPSLSGWSNRRLVEVVVRAGSLTWAASHGRCLLAHEDLHGRRRALDLGIDRTL